MNHPPPFPEPDDSEAGQAALVAWLSNPASYGQGDSAIQRIDTHISRIFLTKDRAYKLKRAVRLPFLDFSTLAQRHQACLTEQTVNARTAPDLYLAVQAITREENGDLALNGHGEPLDWLVVMRRFDEAGLFDRLAQTRALTRDHALALAGTIAAFHQSAECRSDFGGASGLTLTIETNEACFAKDIPGLFDAAAVNRLTTRSRAALACHHDLLERRRLSGFVRHGHGDLHLGNICLIENRPTLFDAIEFNLDFACIDVLYDLAFLLMDLDARGLRDTANLIFNRYLELTGDFGGLPALPLFLSLRAAIRAHVAAAMARDQGRASSCRTTARTYLQLALDYLEPGVPQMLAIGGLSGSGKSRLARALAPLVGRAPGALVLRSDVLRKRLAGLTPETRLPAGAYDAASTEQTYQLLGQEAEKALIAGQSVICDAVFALPWQRQAIESYARQLDIPFHGLWLEAEPALMEQRILTRKNNASDATPAVLQKQLTLQQGEIDWTRIESSGERQQTLEAARRALRL